MSTTLLRAIIFITSALVFYTIGVWSEKISGKLKFWHVVIFYMGLVCDTLGTHFMMNIAGGIKFNLHGVTGAAAIVLMLFHAIWATKVIINGSYYEKIKFHRFSIVVWIIWLFPYILGMLIGMGVIGNISL